MQKSKGYSLIEVLISASIFLIIMTNTSDFLGKILMHTKKATELHMVMHSMLELNEQLYLLHTNNNEVKKQLISSWITVLQQRAPEYCVEIIEQTDTLQVVIKKPRTAWAINITA